jgi:hypothetical protein
MSSKGIILIFSILINSLFFFPPGEKVKDTQRPELQLVINVTEAPFIVWIIMIACLWAIHCFHDIGIFLGRGVWDWSYPISLGAALSTLLCVLSARLACTVCRDRWKNNGRTSEYSLITVQ